MKRIELIELIESGKLSGERLKLALAICYNIKRRRSTDREITT